MIYEDFYTPNIASITAKFLATTSSNENKFPFVPFTEYIFEVKADKQTWQIKKRYKEFEKLHRYFLKKFATLPIFPHKNLFSLRQSIVESRKITLESYLNALLKKTKNNLSNYPILSEFIEIDSNLLTKLNRRSLQHEEISSNYTFKSRIEMNKKIESFKFLKKEKLDFSFDCIDSSNIERVNDEEIQMFLLSLEVDPQRKCFHIDKFWSYVNSAKKLVNYSKENILKLFIGDGNLLKGLLFHCGKIRQNSLGAESCLKLLCKLIQIEYNPDCERYRNVLKIMKIESIQKIQFRKHLENRLSKVRNECFFIMNEYMKRERSFDFKKTFEITEQIEINYREWNEKIV